MSSQDSQDKCTCGAVGPHLCVENWAQAAEPTLSNMQVAQPRPEINIEPRWPTASHLYARQMAARLVWINERAMEYYARAKTTRERDDICNNARRDIADYCYQAMEAVDAERDRLVKMATEAISAQPQPPIVLTPRR